MIPTPEKIEDFSPEWVAFVLRDFFERNEKDPLRVEILKVDAKVNEVQGILSTTFVVDVDYKYGKYIPFFKDHSWLLASPFYWGVEVFHPNPILKNNLFIFKP